MDRYLSGETIDPKVLIEDLEKAVARGSFYPVLATSSLQGIGLAELLEIMTQAFPSPGEHPLPGVTTLDGKPVTGLSCDPDGPLLAEVVKTTSDPYVGRISLVRVFSGTLRPDATVHVSGHGLAERGHADHDMDERIGALTSPLGKQQRPVPQCVAGDICAVAKLTSAETGDTLSDKEHPLLMEPWSMPDPLLPVAIAAKSKADEDKMSQAIYRLVAEDPTLRMENNSETRQLVLWCMGEAHSDLLLDRLSSRYGVGVETKRLRVPLRETVAGKARGLGRNVKQTGGHGEFGVCHIEVEPTHVGHRLRVRGQGRRRRGAPPVHPLGGEGRARPAGAGRAGRLPDGGRQGHPVRRQGALGGLLGHGLPEGGQGGPAGRRGQGEGAAARAGGRAVRAGRGRLRRRGHVRPVLAARPGARHRAGGRAGAPWSRPRCRSWRSPATRSTCARCRTAPARSAAATCATSRCRRTWPTRSPPARRPGRSARVRAGARRQPRAAGRRARRREAALPADLGVRRRRARERRVPGAGVRPRVSRARRRRSACGCPAAAAAGRGCGRPPA